MSYRNKCFEVLKEKIDKESKYISDFNELYIKYEMNTLQKEYSEVFYNENYKKLYNIIYFISKNTDNETLTNILDYAISYYDKRGQKIHMHHIIRRLKFAYIDSLNKELKSKNEWYEICNQSPK